MDKFHALKGARRRFLTGTLALIGATALLLGGCSSSGNAGGRDQSDEKPKVLTTFTILADMARNVAGDHLQVESITRPDQEIHEYQPTPDDIKRAEGAQLVLHNGLGLERWFDRFISQTGVKSVVVTDGIEPIAIAAGDYEGKPNPHAWMSPTAAQIYIDNIVAAFSELDPEHASDYKANGQAYKEKIAQVETQLKTQIATVPENQRVLVTCEGAFSYLARDTGLVEKYLWAVNGEGALTPKHVAEVESYVRDNHVPAVFCESTVGDKMSPVVRATDAKFGGTLYVDSLSGPEGDVPTYLDLLRYDADLITAGLTGK